MAPWDHLQLQYHNWFPHTAYSTVDGPFCHKRSPANHTSSFTWNLNQPYMIYSHSCKIENDEFKRTCYNRLTFTSIHVQLSVGWSMKIIASGGPPLLPADSPLFYLSRESKLVALSTEASKKTESIWQLNPCTCMEVKHIQLKEAIYTIKSQFSEKWSHKLHVQQKIIMKTTHSANQTWT